MRFLYDPAHNVTGGDDPRLGTIHMVLLTHMHGDHVGDQKLKAPGAGTCVNSGRVPAPNSTTAEVVAAKNAALVMTRAIGGFVGNKVQAIRGGGNPGIYVSGAHAMNELVRPASVIITHPNEPVTEGGMLRTASRTTALIKQLKPAAYLAISGRTMEFDGQGKCAAGC